jgi:hypothetical protein
MIDVAGVEKVDAGVYRITVTDFNAYPISTVSLWTWRGGPR